jgi:DNA-binding SARP family transcriptional activator
VQIVLTGAVEVCGEDGPIDVRLLRAAQTRAALGALVLERHAPVLRDTVAEVLWPQRLPASWPVALRGVVAKVRAALLAAGAPPDAVSTSAGTFNVRLPAGVVVDVERAQAHLRAAADALAAGSPDQAIELAAAAAAVAERELLPGLDGPWVRSWRERLAAVQMEAHELVAGAQLARGDAAAAAHAARAVLTVDPTNENGHRLLIAAHGRRGDRVAATRALDRCREALLDELGIDPSPRTLATWRAAVSPAGHGPAGGRLGRPQPEPRVHDDAGPRHRAPAPGGAITERRRHAMLARRDADLAADDAGRGEALVRLAAALLAHGERGEAMRAVLAATDLANRRADPALAARAALVFAGHRRIATRADPHPRRLIEDSLAQLGPAHAELRARLLAALSEQRAIDGELKQARRIARRAGASASAGGRHDAEARLLAGALAGLAAPHDAVERLARAASLYGRLRDDPGAHDELRVADEHRIHAFVELGEWRLACEAMRGYDERARATAAPHARWIAAQHAVCRHTVAGQLRDIDRLVEHTIEPGTAAVGSEIAAAAATMHLIVPRWMQGRLAELAEPALRTASRLGWPPRSRAAAAMFAAAAGDGARAQRAIASILTGDGIDLVPIDADWSSMIFYLVAALRQAPDPRQAAAIARRLAPLAPRDLTFAGLVYYGSTTHHLGALGAICGRWRDAATHLRRAIAHYDQMVAPAWAALARLDLAHVLGRQGAAPAAARLHTDATARATTLGIAPASAIADVQGSP